MRRLYRVVEGFFWVASIGWTVFAAAMMIRAQHSLVEFDAAMPSTNDRLGSLLAQGSVFAVEVYVWWWVFFPCILAAAIFGIAANTADTAYYKRRELVGELEAM